MDTLPTLEADRHSLPEPTEGTNLPGDVSGSAALSACGRYRWWLERVWQREAPRLLFIGLNPSRADGRRQDPTLRRLVRFAGGWGFGGLEVVNLFSRISASPTQLRRSRNPVGDATDGWILARLQALGEAAAAAQLEPVVWLGWGHRGGWRQRDREVLELIAPVRPRLLCLGHTRSGQPRHPLYCRSSLPLRELASSWEERTESMDC